MGIVMDEQLVFSVIKALSSFTEITFFREGLERIFRYQNGILQEEAVKETEQDSGTLIRFTPDECFFNGFQFTEDIVSQTLRNVTYLNEGLDIVLGGIRMKAAAGMKELLADRIPHKGYYLYPIIQFWDETIDVSITHSSDENETIYSFVNGLYTNLGGTHVSSLKEAIASVFLELYPSVGLTPEDIYSGLVAAISINMEHPMFESANTWKLASMSFTVTCSMKEYIHGFFCERFKTYLLEHPESCDIIFERSTIAKKRRTDFKEIVDEPQKEK